MSLLLRMGEGVSGYNGERVHKNRKVVVAIRDSCEFRIFLHFSPPLTAPPPPGECRRMALPAFVSLVKRSVIEKFE